MIIALIIFGKLTGVQGLSQVAELPIQNGPKISLKSTAACKPSLFSNRGFIPHANRLACERPGALRQTLVGKGIRLMLGDVKS